jgi:hypothetical protein
MFTIARNVQSAQCTGFAPLVMSCQCLLRYESANSGGLHREDR